MKTFDYKSFSTYKFNREPNRGLIERLKKSINEIGYLESRPVVVNNDLDRKILDGNNRRIACEELGLPIVYECYNGTCDDPIKIMNQLNNTQQIWRLWDYCVSCANAGIECYKEIVGFELKHKLGSSNSIAIVGGTPQSMNQIIRNRKEFEPNIDAENIYDFLISCKELRYWNHIKFVRAVVVLYKKGNHNQILRLKKKILTIPELPSTSAYLSAFENIINSRVDEKNRIYLK